MVISPPNQNMATIASLQNLFEKFLSAPDGKYEWRGEGFTGYTLHRAGKIIWAEGKGTVNQYVGLAALLRIASNPQVEIESMPEEAHEPNIREDWSFVTHKLREQIRMTIRYFFLKPRKFNLWAHRTKVNPVDIDDMQKSILSKIAVDMLHFGDISDMNDDVLLWQLVVLEEKGAVVLVEPERVEIRKKAD
ncbi:hypothetical protein QPK87_09590 [Kamptonema cortianum]|nr:hypothetical protein [Kamptonema cortianum]MDL5049762.1 hypothetical protein [Oscillatoria amoena NRMC-F 0135]